MGNRLGDLRLSGYTANDKSLLYLVFLELKIMVEVVTQGQQVGRPAPIRNLRICDSIVSLVNNSFLLFRMVRAAAWYDYLIKTTAPFAFTVFPSMSFPSANHI